MGLDSLDTFVRIYLVPDHAGGMQTKVSRTRHGSTSARYIIYNPPLPLTWQVVKSTLTPAYNESFNFRLKRQAGRHSLWFHLYHNGPAHTLIGEAEMEIGEMAKPITTWIPLSDSRKCNARWGELMFSLSYLPTAERLTIVVVKARNLKLELDNGAAEPTTLQNIFVKVSCESTSTVILYLGPDWPGLSDEQRQEGAEEAHLSEAQGSLSHLQRINDLQCAAPGSDHSTVASHRLRCNRRWGYRASGSCHCRQLCGGQGLAPLASDALIPAQARGHVACATPCRQSTHLHWRRWGCGGSYAEHASKGDR